MGEVSLFPTERTRPPLLKQYHMAVVMLEDAAEMLAARDSLDVGFGSLLDALARVMVLKFGRERTMDALACARERVTSMSPLDTPPRPAA